MAGIPNITWAGFQLNTERCTINGLNRNFAPKAYYGRTLPTHEDTGGAITAMEVEGFIGLATLRSDAAIMRSLGQKKTALPVVHPAFGLLNMVLMGSSYEIGIDGIMKFRLQFEIDDPSAASLPLSILNTVQDLITGAEDAVIGFVGDFVGPIGTAFALGSYTLASVQSGLALVSGTMGSALNSAALAGGLVKGIEFLSDGSWTVATSQLSSLAAEPAVLLALPPSASPRTLQTTGTAALLSNALTAKATADTSFAAISITTAAVTGNSAAALASAIQTAVSNFSAAIPDPRDCVDAIGQVITGLTGTSGGSEIVCSFARRCLVASLATAQSSLVFTSSADAQAVQRQVVGLIDNEINLASIAGNTASVTALRDLRTKLVRDIRSRGSSLPGLTTVTMPVALPAVVVAQKLYGDATRADEIVRRNPVDCPLLMPLVLEVLND